MDDLQLFPLVLGVGLPFIPFVAIPPALLLLVIKGLSKVAPQHRVTRLVGHLARFPSILVALTGNAFVLMVCVKFALSIKPGGYGRPMLEAAILAGFAGATLPLGIAALVWEFKRTQSRIPTVIGILSCLAPFPLGGYLLNAIADYNSYFIEP